MFQIKLINHVSKYIGLITEEDGKTEWDSIGEASKVVQETINEALDYMEYYISIKRAEPDFECIRIDIKEFSHDVYIKFKDDKTEGLFTFIIIEKGDK